jgi:multimeric flavodoxin WrbA
MKVLLVNGSHHEKGCTYTALAEVAKALQANGVEDTPYKDKDWTK